MSTFSWDEQNRRTVLEGRQVLERTSASLARSNQIAIETENTGVGILDELDDQRTTLLRASDRLENADEGLKRSNRLLKLMSKNVLYNKLILIAIIALEIFILSGMVFTKFIHKK
ncbi:unnamed protein product [Diamesa hyperborea]